MSSRSKKPRPVEHERPDVETYRLPHWDAHGNLIEDPDNRSSMSAEDVEEIEVAPPTAEEVRQIHEDAYNEGFESGYEQGMRQGQQDGLQRGHQEGYLAGEASGRVAGEKAGLETAKAQEEARIEKHLEPIASVLSDLQEVLPKQEQALKDGLVALAVRIARNVIDSELALRPDHIGELVHAAVQALPNADERLTIELNPEDLALVERVAEGHWQLQSNAALSRGGCIVRTRFSYVDYTLEHRYRQQVSNLLAHVGLTEQLTAFERPWQLPSLETPVETPAETDDALPQESAEPSESPLSEGAERRTNEAIAPAPEYIQSPVDVADQEGPELTETDTELPQADIGAHSAEAGRHSGQPNAAVDDDPPQPDTWKGSERE